MSSGDENIAGQLARARVRIRPSDIRRVMETSYVIERIGDADYKTVAMSPAATHVVQKLHESVRKVGPFSPKVQKGVKVAFREIENKKFTLDERAMMLDATTRVFRDQVETLHKELLLWKKQAERRDVKSQLEAYSAPSTPPGRPEKSGRLPKTALFKSTKSTTETEKNEL